MRRMLLFFIYFINMLITTKIALSSDAALRELNPSYEILPFKEILKAISPFHLVDSFFLYHFLYHFSRSEESRRKIGVSSVACSRYRCSSPLSP